MEPNKRTKVLNAIIRKGGLYGSCAKLYLDDENMGHQFIIECSEQCHNKSAIDHFGEELILEILIYSKAMNIKTEQYKEI